MGGAGAKGAVRAVLLAGLLAAPGCPGANHYGTARTVPTGRWEAVVALEGHGELGPGGVRGTPSPPTLAVRHGLGDRVDLGWRLSNLSTLGVDLKANLLRGTVGLALLPSLRAGWVNTPSRGSVPGDSFATAAVEAAVLIDWRVSPWLTLVLTPGAGMNLALGELSAGSADDQAWSRYALGTQPYARLGAGASWRVSPSLALHPEVTALRAFDGGRVLLTLGLGFRAGGLTP